MKAAPKSFSIHPLLQKMFITLAFSIVALQAAQIVFWIVRQWPYNQNLSSFLIWSLSSIGAPIYFFLVAFCMLPRTGDLWQRAFAATLAATLAVMGTDVLGIISNFVFTHISYPGSYWMSVLYTMLPTILVALLYPIALRDLRRKKAF